MEALDVAAPEADGFFLAIDIDGEFTRLERVVPVHRIGAYLVITRHLLDADFAGAVFRVFPCGGFNDVRIGRGDFFIEKGRTESVQVLGRVVEFCKTVFQRAEGLFLHRRLLVVGLPLPDGPRFDFNKLFNYTFGIDPGGHSSKGNRHIHTPPRRTRRQPLRPIYCRLSVPSIYYRQADAIILYACSPFRSLPRFVHEHSDQVMNVLVNPHQLTGGYLPYHLVGVGIDHLHDDAVGLVVHRE